MNYSLFVGGVRLATHVVAKCFDVKRDRRAYIRQGLLVAVALSDNDASETSSVGDVAIAVFPDKDLDL